MMRFLRSPFRGLALSACLVITLLLAGCSTPPPSHYDPVIKVAADGADASFKRGEVARADALYVKALARARLTDNRDEIVRNSYNLALCRMSLGQVDEARELLVQARLMAGERGAMAVRILLAESEVARLKGEVTACEPLARQALAAGADREGQVQAWLLQGESWYMAGQLQSASDCFRSASKQITRDTPPALRARLNELEAGLVQAGLLKGSIAMLQVSRADWLKQAGQFNEMVKALQAAASAWESESNWSQAFDCRIRAAQSLQAAGSRDRALTEAKKADELAGQTGNVNNKLLATSLVNELK